MGAACKGPKTFSEKLTACSGREVVTANRKRSVDSNEFRGKPINGGCCVMRCSKSATETPRVSTSPVDKGFLHVHWTKQPTSLHDIVLWWEGMGGLGATLPPVH